MNKMISLIKTAFVVNLLMGLAIVNTHEVSAQNVVTSDSTSIALQLKVLNRQRADLEKQIQQADKKRQRSVQGISAESQENMNIAQDSVCLELRSELVEVNLRIGELAPKYSREQLQHVFDRIHQQHVADSVSSAQRKSRK